MNMTLTILAGVISLAGITAVTARPLTRWFERQYRHTDRLRITLAAGCFSLLLFTTLSALSGWSSEGLASLTVVSATAVGLVVMTLPLLQRRPAVTLRPRRILAIGAHPDDVELACGATIAKLVDNGHDVRILVMSEGEVGGDRSARIREAVRAAEYMGVTEHSVYSFCDTRMASDSNEMVAVIEQEIGVFEPDIILTHSGNDIHQDHEAVHRAVMRAARRLPTILCFESPSVGADFAPRFFVDVAEYTDIKSEAIMLHSDQKSKPYMTRERVSAMAGFRGSQVKSKPAEGFEVVRMVAGSVGEL